MLNQEDIKWLAANATELNCLLQQAARQAEHARGRGGKSEYLDKLSDQVERASRTSQAIVDRITRRAPASNTPNETTSVSSGSGARQSIAARIPVGEIALEAAAAGDPVILNPQGRGELILLVDDDVELLESTGEILDFEDYRFITAKDGIQALMIYRRLGKKIDLILLDYFLPVINGDAVFDELKAINPEIRVVLSSGFGEQARVSSMLERGLCAFIPKPYTHTKLIEQIRSVLDA
ncbi:MAG: response regulator [Spartobacteria bacterium]